MAPVKGNQVSISIILCPQKCTWPSKARLQMTKCSDLKQCHVAACSSYSDILRDFGKNAVVCPQCQPSGNQKNSVLQFCRNAYFKPICLVRFLNLTKLREEQALPDEICNYLFPITKFARRQNLLLPEFCKISKSDQTDMFKGCLSTKLQIGRAHV